MLVIKEAGENDLKTLLKLYRHLHKNPVPVIDMSIEDIWHRMLNDKNHHIIGGYIDGVLVSSCIIIIIPNLTRNQQPYALIENVVTEEDHRGKGYATMILNYAKEIAVKEKCYKIMLLTGSKEQSTLDFYRRAGYNSDDKTGFVQWLIY